MVQVKDILCGCEILSGDIVMILIYVLYCYEMFWDELDVFKLECFLDVKLDCYVYLFFGDGFCICIGVSFVLQEVVIILVIFLV